jgi:hypothetical protein
VVRLSSGGPRSIARLAANSQVSRQAITKHLADARPYLDLISREWDDALHRLASFVEG